MLASYLWFVYVPSTEFQFIENRTWIPSIGARYQLGVDGISVHLVVLTFWVVLASIMTACLESEFIAASCSLIYFTQAMAIGAFCALDGLLFYLFWESSLLPMFVYIGAYGSAERRYAAKKYFLYTLNLFSPGYKIFFILLIFGNFLIILIFSIILFL